MQVSMEDKMVSEWMVVLVKGVEGVSSQKVGVVTGGKH